MEHTMTTENIAVIADNLFREMQDLKLQKLSLLTKAGRLPPVQSQKRARWNELADQIAILEDRFLVADDAARAARTKI